MAKYTLSDKEMIRGLLVVVSIMIAPLFFVVLALSLIMVFYLVRTDATWLFPIIGGWIGMILFIISTVNKNYRLQKKLSGNQVDFSVTDTKIVYKIGEVRSEIPYSIIEKAYFKFGYLLLKIAGGGTMAVSIDKLSNSQQKKLTEKLGLDAEQ